MADIDLNVLRKSIAEALATGPYLGSPIDSRRFEKMADVLVAGPVALLLSRIATLEAENARLRATLERIANGDGYTFDESEGCDVVVSLDAEELSSIARAALKRQEPSND